MKRILLLSSLIATSACATITNGSTQAVNVSSYPAGANCDLTRMGAHIGNVPMTPASVTVEKSKNDISVTCTKAGYVTASQSQTPSFGGATFGNILAGGIIGVAVDAASGANYSYHDFNLQMSPDPAIVQASVPQYIINPAYRP